MVLLVFGFRCRGVIQGSLGSLFGTKMDHCCCAGESNSDLNVNLESHSQSNSNLSSSASLEAYLVDELAELDRVIRCLELVQRFLAAIWWLGPMYWISSANGMSAVDAPNLSWLVGVFAVIDVVLVMFGLLIVIWIFTAVFCFLPFVIIVLIPLMSLSWCLNQYIRPSEENCETLSRYNFRRREETEKPISDTQESYVGIMVECDTDTPTEHALSADDAACAICLGEYENGSELYELPCYHHFHCACISNWLLVKSSCPLCNYDIPKGGDQSISIV